MQCMCLLVLFYRSYFLSSFFDSGFSIFFRGEWLKIILVSFSRLFLNFKVFIHFFLKDRFVQDPSVFTKILIPEVFPSARNEVLGMSRIQWDGLEPVSSNLRSILKKIANFLDMQEQLSKQLSPVERVFHFVLVYRFVLRHCMESRHWVIFAPEVTIFWRHCFLMLKEACLVATVCLMCIRFHGLFSFSLQTIKICSCGNIYMNNFIVKLPVSKGKCLFLLLSQDNLHQFTVWFLLLSLKNPILLIIRSLI